MQRMLKAMAIIDGVVDDATVDETNPITFDPSVLKLAAHVSVDLINAVVTGCRESGLTYIMAPHEADGQLCFLAKEGIVDVVDTIDTDLMFLGSPLVVTRAPTKEWTSQWNLLYSRDSLCNPNIPSGVTVANPISNKIDYSLALQIKRIGFSAMEIYGLVCGNDYFKVKNVALARALSIVNRCENNSDESIIKALEAELNVTWSVGMKEDFRIARVRLLNQLVYDPRTKLIIPMTKNMALLK